MITLQECVEKQVAKAPKKEPYLSTHPHCHIGFTHRCPNCCAYIQKYVKTNVYPQPKNNYCYNCGQHLDWSDRNV